MPFGCVRPQADGICRAPRAAGLALCAGHPEVLSRSSGTCAWPGCTQSCFVGPCVYHDKIAHLVIDAPSV